MKLEKKHLAAYFPYQLKVQTKLRESTESGNPMNRTIGELHGLYSNYGTDISVIFKGNEPNHEILDLEIEAIKPILYPLDYINDINSSFLNNLNIDLEDQMQICDFANKKIGLHHLSYGCFQILVENKFDVYNRIENNLAIAVTENFNPYK